MEEIPSLLCHTLFKWNQTPLSSAPPSPWEEIRAGKDASVVLILMQ